MSPEILRAGAVKELRTEWKGRKPWLELMSDNRQQEPRSGLRAGGRYGGRWGVRGCEGGGGGVKEAEWSGGEGKVTSFCDLFIWQVARAVR